MGESKATSAGAVDSDILSLLDARIRRIAEEVVYRHSADIQDDWLTYAQVAEMTGLSEWTVGEAVRRGELEADYPLPRCPRVRRSKLREWMERNGGEGNGAAVPALKRA